MRYINRMFKPGVLSKADLRCASAELLCAQKSSAFLQCVQPIIGNILMFSHEALSLAGSKKLVYTAMSKHYFYFRMHISRYVLEQGKVPLNPFMLFDYFLLDSVDRNLVRDANNSVVLRADETWIFGPISNGVLAEILLAQKAEKPINYFKIEKPHKIIPIEKDDVEMEEEVTQFKAAIISHLY